MSPKSNFIICARQYISLYVSVDIPMREDKSVQSATARLITRGSDFNPVLYIADLGSPFFPGGPELWHHPLAYSTAGELPGTLQHATLVHPALHPQVPVRSYL